MSKQDGYSSRTATDLERKYNFGKTFAEVYNLVSEAKRAAQEAQNAFDGLNQDEIFNLLTDFGKSQGVYRDDKGNVYMNASYIKSGKLAAEYIDATNLKVAAANVTGQLVASQIDTTDLKVSNANISGRLTFSELPTDVASTDDVTEYAAYAAETYIDEWLVSAPTIEGLTVAGGVFTDYEQDVSLYLDKNTGANYGMILEDDDGEIFSVWNGATEVASISLKGNEFLSINDGKIYAWGTWDFSNANVIWD